MVDDHHEDFVRDIKDRRTSGFYCVVLSLGTTLPREQQPSDAIHDICGEVRAFQYTVCVMMYLCFLD